MYDNVRRKVWTYIKLPIYIYTIVIHENDTMYRYINNHDSIPIYRLVYYTLVGVYTSL